MGDINYAAQVLFLFYQLRGDFVLSALGDIASVAQIWGGEQYDTTAYLFELNDRVVFCFNEGLLFFISFFGGYFVSRVEERHAFQDRSDGRTGQLTPI